MREAEEQANKREQKKKKVAAENKLKRERLKNQWVMMACLTNFIEKNKVNWERRGILQEKEKTKVDDLESKEITAEEPPPPHSSLQQPFLPQRILDAEAGQSLLLCRLVPRQ